MKTIYNGTPDSRLYKNVLGEIMAELPRAEATEATVAVYMTGAKRQGGAEND